MSDPDPRPLVVTGANGTIGLRLLSRAREAGVGVRAVVRSERAARVVRESGDPSSLSIVDYGDVDGLAEAMSGAGAVVHLVGILKETAVNRYADAHESSCTALSRAATKAGVERIVYLSILGADPASRNHCLASKGRAERILLDASVPVTVIRLPLVLARGDYATLALAARARARLVPLVRGGASFEQPIDAEDVVTAILAGAAERSAEDLVLDLAGPESLPHRDLLARAARALGRTPPRVLRVPHSIVRTFAAAAGRLLAEPPLTLAMLEVLEQDDRIDPGPACRRLGLTLTPLDDTLKRQLAREDT